MRERLAASKTYKDHAFIFVHGYNTSFDYALYRTAQIAYDLKFDGAPFAYSWPSGGGLASYTYDRESSGQAEPYLKQFIELVIKQTGAKSVSVIAHSMGNQPTLQVLKDLKASKPEGVIISQIILAAPDVDRDNFENIADSIQGLANGRDALCGIERSRAHGVAKLLRRHPARGRRAADGSAWCCPASTPSTSRPRAWTASASTTRAMRRTTRSWRTSGS